MFDTVAEASQKLKNTVVMKDGLPIYVGDASGNDGAVKLEYKTLPTMSGWKNCSIGSVDMRALGERLGYLNVNYSGVRTALYSRRCPVRKSHSTQGLSNSNVAIDRIRKEVATKAGTVSYYPKFIDTLTWGVDEALQGNYPGLSTIRYRMGRDESVMDMAFSRLLSVGRDKTNLWKLNYKGHEIGWTDDLEVFHVEDSWRYLDELFEENKMKVRK